MKIVQTMMIHMMKSHKAYVINSYLNLYHKNSLPFKISVTCLIEQILSRSLVYIPICFIDSIDTP